MKYFILCLSCFVLLTAFGNPTTITSQDINIQSISRAKDAGFSHELVNSTEDRNNRKTPKILGGTKASKTTAKHIANIVIYTSKGTIQCGGSVLTSKTVLTAASCFKYSTYSKRIIYSVYVTAGVTSSLLSSAFIVKNIQIHVNYNEENQAFDAAILTVHGRFKKNEYVPFQFYNSKTYRPPYGSLLFSAGFGFTKPYRASSMSLRLREVLLKNQNPTKLTYGCRTNFLCMTDPDFPNKGGDGICFGDGGAPTYVIDSGVYVQVGIVSYLFLDDDDNCLIKGGIYASYSTGPFVNDFIPYVVKSRWKTIFTSSLWGANIF